MTDFVPTILLSELPVGQVRAVEQHVVAEQVGVQIGTRQGEQAGPSFGDLGQRRGPVGTLGAEVAGHQQRPHHPAEHSGGGEHPEEPGN